jgi:hypothetical protein
MTEEQEMARGQEAETLLESPLTTDNLNHPTLQAVFDDIEAQLTQAWKDAPLRDLEGQQELKRWLAVLTKIRNHLDSVAQNGRMAALAIEQRKNPVQRVVQTTLEKLGIR